MTLALKKKLLAVLLALVAAWPPAQIALVMLYGVNPWKLAGWGMYSAPDLPHPGVRIMHTACNTSETVATRRLSRPARRSIERFRRWRWTFGRLHEPDAVAREIGRASAPYEELKIIVVEAVFDYDTKMVGSVETVYSYRGACPGSTASP